MANKLILSVLFIISITSCFAQKEVSINNIPCHGNKYESDKTNYRGSGYAESSDPTIAREKALIIAKEALAVSIKSQLNSINILYVKSVSKNDSLVYQQEFESITKESIDETLEGINVICQQQEKTKQNKIKYYIACEIGTMPMLQKIEEKIKSTKTASVNFNKERFEKIFNDEIEKFEKTNSDSK